jgi:adenine nucleotide transporter 17
MSSGSSVASSAIPPIGHAIGGSIGSALALLLFYPLERARIEMQANAASDNQVSVTTTQIHHSNQIEANLSESCDSSGESWVSCVVPERREQQTTKQVDVVLVQQPQTLQTGLVSTLSRLYERKEVYQGAESVVITLATSSFVFFYAHQMLQNVLVRRNSQKTALLSLLGSSLAGMLNVFITNPMWVANLRIIKGSKLSLWQEIATIAKTEGWKSLWNGTGTSLLLVSNPVLQFFVYEQIKASRLKKNATATLSPMEAFCVGALAKGIATIATYPLQLAQVLLRLQKGVGTYDCLKKQFDQGGVKGLYTGMNAKLLQTVLTAAFTFLTYEQILRVVRVSLEMTTQKKQRISSNIGTTI